VIYLFCAVSRVEWGYAKNACPHILTFNLMDKNKIIAVFITFAIIALVLFSGNIKFAWNEWKFNNDWKNYNNPVLGLSFDYPAYLSVDNSSSNEVALSPQTYNEHNHIPESRDGDIVINRYSGFNPEMNIVDYVNKNYEDNNMLIVDGITVDGEQGALIVQTNNQTEKTYFIETDGVLYFIMTHNLDDRRILRSMKISKPVNNEKYKVVFNADNKTFINSLYGYQIDFPSMWGYINNDGDLRVAFGMPEFGPGPGFSVAVSTTTFKTAKEASVADKSNIFEKNILIDGVNAVVTHTASITPEGKIWEEFPYYKNTFIVRNGLLFVINSQLGDGYTGADYDKIWNSFKFLNP
jgi:hypothetical protein